MRVAVSGSRTFPQPSFIIPSVLAGLLNDVLGPNALLVGDCPTGADAEATAWAREQGLAVEVFEAEWEKHGLAAGPIRNGEMVDANPDLLVAFTDKPWNQSRGTASAIRMARGNNVPVLICEFHAAKSERASDA